MSCHSDFDIVDDACSIHGHRLENSLFNEADNDRAEPDFDRVGTHGQNAHPLFSKGINYALDDIAKISSRQYIWKGLIEIPEGGSLGTCPTEIIDPHRGFSPL